jgi:AraC-like DNA-binding protein
MKIYFYSNIPIFHHSIIPIDCLSYINKFKNSMTHSENILSGTSGTFLFLWEGIFLYIGNAISTNTHDHHALQIIVSKDKPFNMRVAKNVWKAYRSLIINSDQPHECVLDSGQVFFLGIDPESVSAIKIKENYLQHSHYTQIPESIIEDFIKEIEKQVTDEINCKGIQNSINNFILNLSGVSENAVEIDERIETVISILKDDLSKKIKLKDLSKEVYLSETRLVHLFKEQTGIPIRKYILWYRINSAVKEIINGKTLTEAAYMAEFSDAAHFSRTFRRMFGISATDLLKNSQNIQAFVCTD